MPSLTYKMLACQLPKLGRQTETAVCCDGQAETICCILSLKSELKRILPGHDDLLCFFMEPKANADLLDSVPSVMTNDGIWSEGWRVEREQQSAWRLSLVNCRAGALCEMIMFLLCRPDVFW